MKRRLPCLLGMCAGLLACAPVWAQSGDVVRVRFATYNASFNRATAGALIADFGSTGNTQGRRVAEIIQRVRPDVLLLNEFDYDAAGQAAARFQSNYLGVSQNGFAPITYPYRFLRSVNTGVPSGFDFNNDGSTNGPDDAYGFGAFPGQYGMLVLSKYPFELDGVRTFQFFLWKDMPGAYLPRTAGGQSYYAPAEIAVFRLSSKSHWDLPIQIGLFTVHLLADHPTPPVFDGAEDRNGLRNHDEIRMWADYIVPTNAPYLYDDARNTNHLAAGARFIIAGDQNADPYDGDSSSNAIQQLTAHWLIQTNPIPSSEGGAQAGAGVGGQVGNPAHDTAAFSGNLRVDYLLPSRNLVVTNAGVFWPRTDQAGYSLISASDHRLVWMDVVLPNSTTGMLLNVF